MVFRIGFMVMLLTAVFFDLEEDRIPNGLIILMWLLGTGFGLGKAGMTQSAGAVGDVVAGGVLPLIIFFPLFKGRLMGAGDIKLMSAIGTCVGLRGMADTVAAAFFLAGLLSLGLMSADASFGRQMGRLGRYARQSIAAGVCLPYQKNIRSRVHFSVPLLMGGMLYMGGVI